MLTTMKSKMIHSEFFGVDLLINLTFIKDCVTEVVWFISSKSTKLQEIFSSEQQKFLGNIIYI